MTPMRDSMFNFGITRNCKVEEEGTEKEVQGRSKSGIKKRPIVHCSDGKGRFAGR